MKEPFIVNFDKVRKQGNEDLGAGVGQGWRVSEWQAEEMAREGDRGEAGVV